MQEDLPDQTFELRRSERITIVHLLYPVQIGDFSGNKFEIYDIDDPTINVTIPFNVKVRAVTTNIIEVETTPGIGYFEVLALLAFSTIFLFKKL